MQVHFTFKRLSLDGVSLNLLSFSSVFQHIGYKMFKAQLRCAWLCSEIANPLVNNKVCSSANSIRFGSHSLVLMGFIQLSVRGFHSEIMPEKIMVSLLLAFQTCVCECRSPMRVSGGDWWGHSGAEAALTWESAHTLGAFGCFIMMSLCCIAASEGATLYSEAELNLQTLPLFFARLFFSVSLSLPVEVSFILFFFVLFPPAGHRIPQNPPFVPFSLSFLPFSSLALSPSSLSR